MLLNNGSIYNIFDTQHTIKDHCIFNDSIPITEQYKLERLYMVIKYTCNFLDENDIDYCIEGGTLLGQYRHDGIIPWDNDVDIMIFKDGYYRLLELMNNYNNDIHKILQCTPGFKLFYDNECYGELFVYDIDTKDNMYKLAYPYVDNNPTFYTSKLYFKQSFTYDQLFPTKKILFEDFYVSGPNMIEDVLHVIYRGDLNVCYYVKEQPEQHHSISYNIFKIYSSIEKLLINKYFIYIYAIIHYIIGKFFMVYI